MRKLFAGVPAFIAAPAFADAGGHVHPHGADVLTAVAAGAAIILAAGAMAWLLAR